MIKKKKIKSFFLVIFVNFFFILSFDFIFGDKILSLILKNDREYFETKYRIHNNIFNHNLKADFDGYGWWHKKYRICTNTLGNKSKCETKSVIENKYDIIFIGDSNTEGIGLTWEDSFIGKISKKLKNKEILNLAVAGYSFSNYLSKLNYYLNIIDFNEVIIFVDPSDVYDERILNINKTENDYIVDNLLLSKRNILLKNLLKPFPITSKFIINIRRLFLKKIYKQDIKLENYLSEDFNLTHWLNENNTHSLNDKISYDRLINKSLRIMETLYEILNKENIKLSLVVYPHPAQIFNNNLDSRNEKIWKKFCLQRCDRFINLSSYFENLKLSKSEIISKYYINGDVHFNKYGSELISELFLENFN